MHLCQVSGRRRAAFRSSLYLAPRVAAEVVKVCCGSQRRDPGVVLGWSVHRDLRGHLLVAPVSSGPCGGLCSGGLLVTALLFLILCWDRSHQQDLMDERGLKQVAEVQAQLMFNWSCAHSCVLRVWVPVALWFLGCWDGCDRGASSWDKSIRWTGHQKCGGACPELRGESEIKKNLCFLFFLQREGSRV